MHSRHTVRYICEVYPSGNRYYYKQELITHDTWRNPESIAWSRPRPITRRTFEKAKKAGYPVVIRHIKNPPADIVCLPPAGDERRERRGRAKSARRRKKDRGRLERLLLR